MKSFILFGLGALSVDTRAKADAAARILAAAKIPRAGICEGSIFEPEFTGRFIEAYAGGDDADRVSSTLTNRKGES